MSTAMVETKRRTGEIRHHDSTLAVWEEDPRDPTLRTEVFEVIIRTLRRDGWRVRRDPNIHRHYRTLSANHRYCRLGDLEAALELSGRRVSIEFFQNVAKVENRNGGRYDFNKLSRMPYLLRQRALLTMKRIGEVLTQRNDYTVRERDPEPAPGSATGAEWIEHRMRSSGHFNADLGRADYRGDLNRKDATGQLLKHGQVAWWRGRDGRVRRGRAYYYLNNMWALLLDKWEVAYPASFEMHAAPPPNLRGRHFSVARRKQAIERRLVAAVRTMDFKRAEALRRALEALIGQPVRFGDGFSVEVCNGEGE